MVTTLSQSQARRISLAAQGFLDKPTTRRPCAPWSRTVERTGVLQVDSVNVLQRAHFMPLYSRMGALRRRLCWARASAQEAAPAGRVLGARAGADAGRAVAGDAVPDGLLPHPEAQVVGERGQRGARQEPDGRDRRPGRLAPRATSTTACPGQEALGLELVGDQARARLPLHDRRGRDRRAQQPVRGQVRPARAGAARRRAGRADAHPRGGQPRARPPRRAVARRGDRAVPGRLLPDAAPADRRSRAVRSSWSRRAS